MLNTHIKRYFFIVFAIFLSLSIDCVAQVAVNESTNTIYVINGSAISVVNGATNTLTTTIPVSANPMSIAVDPGANVVYVLNHGGAGQNITVINGASNTVTTTVPTNQFVATGLAFDSANATLYVAGSTFSGAQNSSQYLAVFNPATNSFGAFINVDIGFNITSAAVNPNTNTIYATGAGSDTGVLYVVNGISNTFIGRFDFNTGVLFGVNASTNNIYIQAENAVVVVNGTSNTQSGAISATGFTGLIAVNSQNNIIYFEDQNGTEVANGTTNSVIATIPIIGQLGVNSSTNTLYIVNGGLKVINGSTNTVTTTIPL